MAVAAACKRLVQQNRSRLFNLNDTSVRSIWSSSTTVDRYQLDNSSSQLLSKRARSTLLGGFDGCVQRRRYSEQVQSNGGKQRAFLVDTLAMVRRLEKEGVPTEHAEAITTTIIQVLNDSLENVSQSFTSKVEMDKIVMKQDANLSEFKAEVKSAQEHHFTGLKGEVQKLQGDIDKMRTELKHEIDKVTAGQRLDLNLERGRNRDELAKQNAETTSIDNKIDREIHGVKAQLEAAKYDVIKYCIGTLVSISAIGLAIIRILI